MSTSPVCGKRQCTRLRGTLTFSRRTWSLPKPGPTTRACRRGSHSPTARAASGLSLTKESKGQPVSLLRLPVHFVKAHRRFPIPPPAPVLVPGPTTDPSSCQHPAALESVLLSEVSQSWTHSTGSLSRAESSKPTKLTTPNTKPSSRIQRGGWQLPVGRRGDGRRGLNL